MKSASFTFSTCWFSTFGIFAARSNGTQGETGPLAARVGPRPRRSHHNEPGDVLEHRFSPLVAYLSALPRQRGFRVRAPERRLERPSRLLSRGKGPQAAHITPGAAPKRLTCIEQAQANGERQQARSVGCRQKQSIPAPRRSSGTPASMHGSAMVRRSKRGGAGRAPRHALVVLCRDPPQGLPPLAAADEPCAGSGAVRTAGTGPRGRAQPPSVRAGGFGSGLS